MYDAIIFKELKYETPRYIRPTIVCASIADLHFGIIDPEIQYQIYRDEILVPLTKFHFDIIFINGDTFDHKCMANSEIAKYTLIFMSELVELCRYNNASLIILQGTLEHDANQLKMFYQYMNIKDIDVRVIETLSMIYVKGAKVLCIPELYNFPEETYQKYLFNMGVYDLAIMHGVYNGSVYGNNAGYSRVFYPEDFALCRGPVLSGHIHTPGCYDGFVYYSGIPIRCAFGQEETKGFYILAYNLEDGKYYVYMQEVKSFLYNTINIYDNISDDPKEIIHYIENYRETNNIDCLRVVFNSSMSEDIIALIKNYFRNKSYITLIFNFDTKQEKMKDIIKEQLDKFSEYEYVLNKNATPYQILSKFINDNEGYEFITPEELEEEIKNEI